MLDGCLMALSDENGRFKSATGDPYPVAVVSDTKGRLLVVSDVPADDPLF